MTYMRLLSTAIVMIFAALILSCPVAAEDRTLGIAVRELPSRSYDEAARIAAASGARYATLPLQWDEVETKPGKYSPETDWLAIAAAYYPTIGWKVALEFNPIDTLADRRPAWLKDKPWDDPEVIRSFQNMLREVMPRSADIELVSLAVGNEVDAHLGADGESWAHYTALVVAARDVVKSMRPALKLGVKTTFPNATGDTMALVQALNEKTDLVMITYYPITPDFHTRSPASPKADFELMTAAYPEREIHLAEIGYPSGGQCSSGEEAQSEFVANAFAAWDQHASQIKAMYWDWMTDISAQEVGQAADYYRLSDRCFSEFVATLGLETREPRPKKAWHVFADEARRRFR